METVENLRDDLISKIQAIEDKGLLLALENLIASGVKPGELTESQKEMLDMSEEDIRNGRLISQEAMDKRNIEWLNGL